jgi:hypothetical protein
LRIVEQQKQQQKQQQQKQEQQKQQPQKQQQEIIDCVGNSKAEQGLHLEVSGLF